MNPAPALRLFPSLLAEGCAPTDVIPEGVLASLRETRDFVVENAKTARRFLAACAHPGPMNALGIAVLDQQMPDNDVASLLAPLRAGRTLGLLSEAGAPAVADPGARLVAAAHAEGFRVVPFSGPSSILLALMASGLEGQRFRFVGYLPVPAPQRQAAVRDLEARSAAARETQIFIETPYRNDALLSDVLATCRGETRLAVAADLTAPTEMTRMSTVDRWRQAPTPIGKRPAIFLLLAASGSARRRAR